MKYLPGQSGNPKGRPKGILNKRTQLSLLLESRGDEITAKLIEMAVAGDINAIRLCVERLIPRLREEVITPDEGDNTNITPELIKQYEKEF